MLHAAEVSAAVEQVQAAGEGSIRSFIFPSFLELLKDHAKPFEYTKHSWRDAVTNPVVVLHSSGSTGQPKPITMTHGTFSILDLERKLPGVPGRQNRDYRMWDLPGDGRFYHIFPTFHLSGFLANSSTRNFSHLCID